MLRFYLFLCLNGPVRGFKLLCIGSLKNKWNKNTLVWKGSWHFPLWAIRWILLIGNIFWHFHASWSNCLFCNKLFHKVAKQLAMPFQIGKQNWAMSQIVPLTKLCPHSAHLASSLSNAKMLTLLLLLEETVNQIAAQSHVGPVNVGYTALTGQGAESMALNKCTDQTEG